MAGIVRRPSPREMAASVARFNASHAIGDEIFVWPGARVGSPVSVKIVAPGAYVLSGHTAVVQVTGGHGCIALTHVAANARVLAQEAGRS